MWKVFIFCGIVVGYIYSCITPNSFVNVASLLSIGASVFHRRWCIVKLHGVFWNVSSSCLPEKKHIHIGCICLTFIRCVFLNVSSKRLHKRMPNHIGCICSTFLRCAFSDVPSSCLNQWMHNYTGCISFCFSPLCVLRCLFKFPNWEDA